MIKTYKATTISIYTLTIKLCPLGVLSVDSRNTHITCKCFAFKNCLLSNVLHQNEDHSMIIYTEDNAASTSKEKSQN